MQSIKLLVSALLLAVGCAGGAQYHLEKQPGVVTLVNLHPDPNLRRLYSTNYQQAGLIPLCTPVTIQAVSPKLASFSANGVMYQYIFAKQLLTEKGAHLDQFFGKTCPDVTALSEEDQAGIRSGRIAPGMTRQGVILAAGHPPDHVNRLDGDVWKYWKNRFGTFDVIFDGDVVKEVKD